MLCRRYKIFIAIKDSVVCSDKLDFAEFLIRIVIWDGTDTYNSRIILGRSSTLGFIGSGPHPSRYRFVRTLIVYNRMCAAIDD